MLGKRAIQRKHVRDYLRIELADPDCVVDTDAYLKATLSNAIFDNEFASNREILTALCDFLDEKDA